MLGMKKGGSRFIIIPPDLAYGSKGVPNCIPANSTLLFEAELRRVIILYFLLSSDVTSISPVMSDIMCLFLIHALGEAFQGQWL